MDAGNYGSEVPERIAEYRKQFKAKPKLEVDEAAMQMVEALDELQKPTSDANEILAYRNKKNPDRCAKIKAVHPLLMAGWHKYLDGLAALDPYVEQFADDRDRREVETTLKKYGKHYRYHFARIVVVSKGILHRAERLLQSSDPDPTPVLDRLARLTEIVDETKEMIAHDTDPKKNDPYPPGLSLLIIDSMPRFLKTVKECADVFGDKAKRKNEKVLKSTWKEFADAYNSLVDRMNRVSFEKSQK
jgi:ElaB/YqjD/DUF883 family membrane-anchored ribosome-binding protein